MEVVSGSGEFGNSFDDFGDRFTCDAVHIIYHAVLPREYLARNPYLLNVPDHELSPGKTNRTSLASRSRVGLISPERVFAITHEMTRLARIESIGASY